MSIKVCRSCGKVFKIDAAKADLCEKNKWPEPENCPSCVAKKYVIVAKLVCLDCGKVFQFNQLQQEQLIKRYGKAFHFPQYCPQCRKIWLGGRKHICITHS
jgi:Fe2+ or Zn2+ uptake regulation protein